MEVAHLLPPSPAQPSHPAAFVTRTEHEPCTATCTAARRLLDKTFEQFDYGFAFHNRTDKALLESIDDTILNLQASYCPSLLGCTQRAFIAAPCMHASCVAGVVHARNQRPTSAVPHLTPDPGPPARPPARPPTGGRDAGVAARGHRAAPGARVQPGRQRQQE